MKKRTSKSASATKKTSSRSGTSAPLDATANKQKPKPRRTSKFGYVVARIDDMSSQEFRQSLIALGIIDKAGKLTKKYKQAKRA